MGAQRFEHRVAAGHYLSDRAAGASQPPRRACLTACGVAAGGGGPRAAALRTTAASYGARLAFPGTRTARRPLNLPGSPALRGMAWAHLGRRCRPLTLELSLAIS